MHGNTLIMTDLSDFKRDVIHLFYMQKEMEEVPIFLIYDKSNL